jgi:hypothetical protein
VATPTLSAASALNVAVPETAIGPVDNLESPARLQRVEVGGRDDEAEMIGVLARPRCGGARGQ